jgi:glutamate-1-semialdehyde aminotransferase
VAGLRLAIETSGVPALVQNAGPMLQILFLLPGHEGVTAIGDARISLRTWTGKRSIDSRTPCSSGVYLSPAASLHSVLSTVHADADIDTIIAAAAASFQSLEERPVPC